MLSERNEKILCAIVQTYIRLPEPVGSRLLSRKYNFNLSSATIRNVMADLEEVGYLSQPHTSAGRVPTDKAFRYYVDTVCGIPEDVIDEDFTGVLESRLVAIRSDLAAMLEEAARTLSTVMHNVVFAVPLNYERTTLNRIQFFRYRGKQVVTILITNEGLIKSKVIDNEYGLSQKELNRISDYLNSEFSGRTLGEVRSEIVKQISNERAIYDILMSKVASICREAISFPPGEIIMAGLSELIKLPDISDRINEVTATIEDKDTIIKILDGFAVSSVDLQVVIGDENPVEGMKKLSIVMAPYKQGDVTAGTVGIIGPTRMDYLKAVRMIDTVARFITAEISK